MYHYQAFGLNIESELLFRYLPDGNSEEPDVKIKFERAPDSLDYISGKGLLYQVAPDNFLFRVNNIGAF